MELNTVIRIGGKDLIQKPLPAIAYFEYEKRKTTQSVKLANEWLQYEAFGDIDISTLKFRDRGRLLMGLTNVKVQFNDDLPLEDSSDFTVAGNRFTEKPNSGDIFDQFILKAQKDAIASVKWAIPQVFLMNGQEITDKDFTLSSPDGIGFEGASILTRWLQSFLS